MLRLSDGEGEEQDYEDATHYGILGGDYADNELELTSDNVQESIADIKADTNELDAEPRS